MSFKALSLQFLNELDKETKFKTLPPFEYILFPFSFVPAWKIKSLLFNFKLFKLSIFTLFVNLSGYPLEHSTIHKLFSSFHSKFIFSKFSLQHAIKYQLSLSLKEAE